MKKLLSAAAGLLCIAHAQGTLAQSAAPCDVKGIVTDPAAPAINPEYPLRTNTFNWYYGQHNNGREWSLNSQALPAASAIWMPWEQSDNTNMTHILGKRDLPKDGWELVKRNLGYQDNGTPYSNLVNPYVVLYNKRSGMLRVFVATGERAADYQFAEIKLTFSGSAAKKAGTLNRVEGLGVALENTLPGIATEFAAVTRFLNQSTKWFMADFPMEYDPCACQFDSKLIVAVRLISEADIKLTGTTTGTLLSIDPTTKASSTGTDFDKAVAMMKKVNGVLSKSQNTYKTIDGYKSAILGTLTGQGAKSSTADANEKKSAVTQLMNAIGTNSFLKNGLSAVPYIGAAVSILDSFIGGGKEESGPQPVSLQPMSINMTTELSGTMRATALYETITFNNPGTRQITTPEEYPYYNEALGVLSVLRKPVIEVRNTTYTDPYDGRNRRLRQFRVPTPIQYVLNPASGLEVQDFQVAILQEGKNYPAILPDGSGWFYEGITSTETHTFRTDYVDAGELNTRIFDLDVSNDKFQSSSNSEFVFNTSAYPIYLKLMLNLRPRNASGTTQNVLLVLKYPVTVQNVTAFGPITPQPGGILPQADAATVQAFCTSSVYTAAMNLRPAAFPASGTTPPAAPAVADVQLYPNPTADVATLRFTGVATGRVSAYLTDMVGHRVLTILEAAPITAGEQHQSFSTTGLAAGLYQCVVETTDGRKSTTRLSIVR